MFLSLKRNLARENEDLKAQIAALTRPASPVARQGWGLGLEQGRDERDQERFEFEKTKLDEQKYWFEARAEQRFAGQVVQALLLLNGAAALIVLIFIGIFARDAALKGMLLGLSGPLALFCDGAAMAVITGIFAYLGQASSADGSGLWRNTLKLFAMVLALSSLLLFAAAISRVSSVFATLS